MNYKILMVDDDRELLKMLNQYFTLKNYTVIIAENGIEAMEKISANPDIILLDVNMPGMDGIEVCRRIRDMVSCPIIFLTAKVEEQDRVMGLLSGGDDYVLKPINEQISNFAQTYPTNLKASSNEALLFMRRYRFANCSCFSCCFKDAYPSSNVQ